MTSGTSEPINWCAETQRLINTAHRAEQLLPDCFDWVSPQQKELIVSHAIDCSDCSKCLWESGTEELKRQFLHNTIDNLVLSQDQP